MTSPRALYPGSFDPMTNGHLDLILRAAKIFSQVEVAVLDNISKWPLFTVEERVRMIRESVAQVENVSVSSFTGLTVEYARKLKCNSIIRGLRAVSDYENEFKMALANRELDPDIETFFLVSDTRYTFLSSSTVKEIAGFGRSVDPFVPPHIAEKIRLKYEKG